MAKKESVKTTISIDGEEAELGTPEAEKLMEKQIRKSLGADDNLVKVSIGGELFEDVRREDIQQIIDANGCHCKFVGELAKYQNNGEEAKAAIRVEHNSIDDHGHYGKLFNASPVLIRLKSTDSDEVVEFSRNLTESIHTEKKGSIFYQFEFDLGAVTEPGRFLHAWGISGMAEVSMRFQESVFEPPKQRDLQLR